MDAFVTAEKATTPVRQACKILGISTSAYYRRLGKHESTRVHQDTVLATELRSIHAEHRGRYGSPRAHRELVSRGYRVSRKRVIRIRQANGLRAFRRRRYRHTTDSRRTTRIADNLVARNFLAAKPNMIWVGDVTYIPTADGWLYLAVLIDLYSRRVVGWAMSDVLNTPLVAAALSMAVSARAPQSGLWHHTDRDGRYASDDYLEALSKHGIEPSMSRKGDCWDNAVAESFFATLEKELLSHGPLTARADTYRSVASYIESYYNLRRRHSYIDYMTPIEYELSHANS